MIKTVILLDDVGELIVYRNFIGVLDRTCIDLLRTHVVAGTIPQPVFRIPPHTYVYKRCESFHFIAIVTPQGDTMAASNFLEQLFKALQSFAQNTGVIATLFGTKQVLTKTDLRRKIPLIHELLDEMIDGGEITTTDPEVLKLFIKTGTKIQNQPVDQNAITVQATGALSHRRQGIVYKNNEIFIDVFEKVNAMFNSSGQLLHSDVDGYIEISNTLTGMPECNFGFNDRLVSSSSSKRSATSKKIAGFNKSGVVMEDVNFHNCVRLGNFAVDRSITFVPPDGKFRLMDFRITEEVKDIFSLKPIVTVHGRNRMEAVLNLRCNIPNNLLAEKIIISIPMPGNVSSVETVESLGKAKLRKDGKACEWRIRSLAGGATATLNLMIHCVNSSDIDLREWKRPAIGVDFEVIMFTASGIEVRYIRVIAQEGYQTRKWLKYLTTAGVYQVRW